MRVFATLHEVGTNDGIPGLDAIRQIAERLAEPDRLLRWGIVGARKGFLLLEVARLVDGPKAPHPPAAVARLSGCHVALVIPTGLGAEIGGFVGDAGPAVRALEQVVDTVITNPNAVNGADFYGGGDRSLYVEGWLLDEFFAGRTSLGRPTQPRVGLLLDRLDASTRRRLLAAADGMVAVRGTNVVAVATARVALAANVHRSELGHYLGSVDNLEALVAPALELVAAGANAIAVCTEIGGITDQDWTSHYGGNGVNPVGAIEALISRTLTRIVGVPCVHAPASLPQLADTLDGPDARAASELSSGTGLPCLLEGLGRVGVAAHSGAAGIHVDDLAAIILPTEAVGGEPAAAALRSKVPLILVRQNACTVGVDAAALGISGDLVIEVESYPEAIGIVAALRARISPRTMTRPLRSLHATFPAAIGET